MLLKPGRSPVDKNREELIRSRNWSQKFSDEQPAPPLAPAEAGLQRQSEQFNARVHQELAGIPVPPTLRDQILARRIIIPVPFWKEPRALAAIAATILLLVTGLVFLTRPPQEDQTFAGFRSRMVGFALREYRMDIHTNQLAAVQTFLAEKGAPAQFSLPAPLANTPVKGGAKLSWQGKPVGMVCFSGAKGQTLYMFVIDSTLAANTTPEVSNFKSLATATWSADGKTFLLAAPLPSIEVERLVRT
jgi:hypothetical protein